MSERTVPKLRFPEFIGEWEYKKLSVIANIYDGTHQTPTYVDFGIPFYSVENVTANDFNNTKFISQEVFDKESKRVKIENGDILMTRIGDIGTSKYISWDANASFYVSLSLIKINNCNVNSKFVNQYINTNIFQSELWDRTIHVAFPKKINLGEIGNCVISIPSLDEQTKIADFLTSIDDKIQQLTKKKGLLEQYKKGVMRDIFSQKIRFKDDNGNDYPDWKEKRLDEICTFFSGGTPTSSNKDYYNGDIPFIGSGNISSNQVEQFITREALTNSSAKMIENGDLLLALYGATSGQSAIAKLSGAINQAVLCIRTQECKEFIFYWLQLNKDNILSSYLQGGQGNLSAQIIKQLEIDLPSIAEQIKTSGFLASIDNKITQVSTQLEQTKLFKNSLLQQMFI